MGRFESNALAPRYRHHPPRDSRDLDGRLSGSLAAFKFAISAHFKKSTADSFRKDFAPRPILLFQKMRGWLRSSPPPPGQTWTNPAMTDLCPLRLGANDRQIHLHRRHRQALPGGGRWRGDDISGPLANDEARRVC